MIHNVREKPIYKMVEVSQENLPDILELIPNIKEHFSSAGVSEDRYITAMTISPSRYRLWSASTGTFDAQEGNIIVLLDDTVLLYENMEEFEQYFVIV